MNIMDSSFENYDGSLYGDCTLEQQFSMHWEHDVDDVIKGAGCGPVNVNKTAPGFLIEKVLPEAKPEISDSHLSDGWVHDQLPLFDSFSSLDGEFDLESYVRNAEVTSFDIKKENESTFDACSSVPVDALFPSLKDVSHPGSPDSGIGLCSAASPLSVRSNEDASDSSVCSPISSLEDIYSKNDQLDLLNTESYADDLSSSISSPESHGSSPGTPSFQTLPLVSTEELSFLESLWRGDELPIQLETDSQTLGSERFLTAVVLQEPIISIPPIVTSKKSEKPGKTKSLTSTQKRERKRTQNKNAATRYREKKRTEANVIYVEQTELEDKKKGLSDKVTLISREIQYMKELLIEVYRTKGIIE